MSNQVPIAEGLFTWPSAKPALLASRCRKCGIAAFPVASSCMACSGQDVEIEELPSRGTLWTWTVQQFMPKEPYKSDETARDFQSVWRRLSRAPRVASGWRVVLTENDPQKLQIGMEMDVVFEPYRTEENGDEVINFFFRPVQQSKLISKSRIE